MFRFRLLAALLFISTIAVSQQIPIQFALTDTAGIELQNRTVNIKATLTSDTTSFTPEYQETQSVTTNDFGIASFWIGEGNITLSSSNASINTHWLNPMTDYFIVLGVDSTGGGYSDLATIRYKLPLVAVKSQNSDTSVYAQSSDTSIYATQSNQANQALLADTSDFALKTDSSSYSSTSATSFHALTADTSQFALATKFSDTAGYSIAIDPGAFSDSSSANEIQSLGQVLVVDSNAQNTSIYNLKSLTIGDTIIPTSAALSINRNDAGLLLPRLTKVQRDIIYPVQGLMVYCTDCETEGRVSVYDGSTWELLSQTNSTGSYAVISAGTIENISVSGATLNGSISDSGGTTVFAKGFCLSSQPYPTLSDLVIAPALLDSYGVFKGRANYLERNSKYYVRAYATNAAGTVYGPQQEFLTEGLLAVGDTFGGGIVGYILQPGDNGYDPDEQHGIIIANQDYGTNLTWGSCNDIVPSNSESPGTYKTGHTSEFIYDAYYNDSVWNSICHDSLAAYSSYTPSIMHIVRDISWGGYSDWTVGTIGDYMAIFTNITTLDTLLNQMFLGEYWTSSGCRQTSNYYNWTTTRYRFRFRSFTSSTTNTLTGVVTYNRVGNSDRVNYDTAFLIRPVRYF